MNKPIKRKVDLAIIGAGPGGLGAAIKAKEEGLKDVLLIERSKELGGILPQCIHNGFGLQYFKEELTGPTYAYRLIKQAEKLGVEILTNTMVIELNKNKQMTVVSENGVMEVDAKAILLSMGCRERPLGSLRVPGSRPSGIFTAGTAQRLINIEGYVPGENIVILGSGDIGMIMARRLTLEGAKVECIVELFPFIGGLIRNEVQCLKDYNIPAYTGHTITKIEGKERLAGVTISKVDSNRNAIAGSEKQVSCDTLLLSVGLIPENELSIKAGITLNPLTGGPIVDETWQTSIPGIFAGGNVVHVHDLADYVTESCEAASSSAVRYVVGEAAPKNKIEVKPGKNIRYVVPNYISGEKPVSFFMRVAWPYKNATVDVGGKYVKKVKFARPSEQIRIDVPAEALKEIDKEIVVSCEGEEVAFA